MSLEPLFEAPLPDGKRQRIYLKAGAHPEIHVDGAWGLLVGNDAVKINLTTSVPSTSPNTLDQEIAVRLAMSIPTLFQLRDFLSANCQKLIESGAVAEIVPDPSADDKKASN